MLLSSSVGTVRPVFASGSDKIYEATSYGPGAGKVYDISSGTPSYFATVPPGSSPTPWLGPLGVRGDGHLFAVTNAGHGSLWDITAGGDYTFATPLASNIFGSSLSYPEGLAFDSSNNAYITNSEEAGQQIAKVTSAGVVSYLTGTFNNARGLTVVGNTLYIAEGGSGKVLAYDLSSNTVSTFASGFVPSATSYIAATLTLDTSGNIVTLWSGAGSGKYGLYKVTSGTDYTGLPPMIQYNPSPYTYIDVNQLAIDSSNNAYVAGAYYGYSWESAYSAGSYQPFTQFASGLGDTESLAIIRVAASSTSISCSPSSFAAGSSSTCTATVTGSAPTGTVTWTSSSAIGSFSSSGTCTLISGSCSVGYSDSASGAPVITATYGGDAGNLGSSGTFALTITSGGKDKTSTTVSCAPNPDNVNAELTCTTTVTDIGSVPTTLTGRVAILFAMKSSTPALRICSLSTIGVSDVTARNVASCTVTFTPRSTGTLGVLATYLGDSTHSVSVGTTEVTIRSPPA